MTTIANSMFGFLKKFFTQSGGGAAAPAIATPPIRNASIPMPPMAASPIQPKRENAPATTTPQFAAVPPSNSPTVPLPLHEILARLPEHLSGQVLARPLAIFSLPTNFVLEQLKTGAVRIPFGQLRQSAPTGTFANTAALDTEMVDLPLPLVLAAVGPRGFTRRQDQRQAGVPDEVTGVFDTKFETKNGQVKRIVTTVAPPPSPVQSVLPPAVLAAMKAAEAAPVLSVAAPEPIAIPAPVKNVQISPVIVPKPVTVETVAPVSIKPSTSISTSFINAPKAVSATPPSAQTLPFASAKTASALPFATKRPAMQPASAPIPLPLPGLAAKAEDEFLFTTVEVVSANWPEAIREQIRQFDLQSAPLSIPIDRVEPGLKSGRIVFLWSEVSGWIKAPRPALGEGETPVELPLRVVAPLYLKKRPPGPARRTAPSVEHVPDVFAAAHAKTHAPEPIVLVPEPVAAPAVPMPTVVPDLAPDNILGEIFNDMSKTQWTPQEIVDRTCTLHGISGALLAARDGLLVAGKLPSPMKPEMMAAFIPQMFARVGGSTEAAQLGTLRALKVTAGASPCSIFKAGSLYLAVLGRNGQQIPETALERIAEAASQTQANN